MKTIFGDIKLNKTSNDSTIKFMDNTTYGYIRNLYGNVNSNKLLQKTDIIRIVWESGWAPSE